MQVKSILCKSLLRKINVTLTLHFLRLSEHILLEIRVRLAKIAKRTGHTVRNIKVKFQCQSQTLYFTNPYLT